MSSELNRDRLREEVNWWIARHEDRASAIRSLAQDARCSVSAVMKIDTGSAKDVSIDLADRLLIAMGLTWRGSPRRLSYPRGQVTSMVIRSKYEIDGRKRQPGEGGRIKKVDFKNAKLNEKQLRAIYRLHIEGGISLRALARAGYKQWGFANEKSALNSLSDRLRSMKLIPRNRIEATIKASTTHGRGSRKDKAAYKRWHRAAFGPWPSDTPPPDWEKVRASRDWSKPTLP